MGIELDHPVSGDAVFADAPLERFIGTPRQFKPLRRRPLKAWHHMKKLIADKEATDEVFHIIRALNGDSFERSYQTFLAHPNSRTLMAEAQVLPPVLDDHERWLELPEGSFGREYVEFMRREGLTAAGLVEESLKSPESREWRTRIDPLRLWYADRSRDTHDMFHILTGLGRDALGEACVLSFTYPQHGRGLGLRFIALVGAREVGTRFRKATGARLPWRRALRECRRMGEQAAHLEATDLVALFPLPLAEVRERLGIGSPDAYHACHRIMAEHGIDPYGVMSN